MLAARLLLSLFRGASPSNTESDEDAYAGAILLASTLRIVRNKNGFK